MWLWIATRSGRYHLGRDLVMYTAKSFANAAQHRLNYVVHGRPLELSTVRQRAGMTITFANLMMKCKSLRVKVVAWCAGRWSMGWLSCSAFLPESFAAR